MPSATTFTAPRRCGRPKRTSPTSDWHGVDGLWANLEEAGLAALRVKGESYSDVILRLAANQTRSGMSKVHPEPRTTRPDT